MSALNAVVGLAVVIVMSAVVALVAASGLNAMAPRVNGVTGLIPTAGPVAVLIVLAATTVLIAVVAPIAPTAADVQLPIWPPPARSPSRTGSREPDAPEYNDLVWGLHASQAILESERPIHRIWCTPELRFRSRFLQLLREAKSSGVLVEEVTWARLAQLSGGAVHQGIVLQTAAAQTHDLETLIDSCAGLGEAPLLMAVDGLTDPHNLGAIVRSAEALGAHGLVLPQRRSAGLTGSVAKVAAGALEHLPVARVVNLNRSLERLKDAGTGLV